MHEASKCVPASLPPPLETHTWQVPRTHSGASGPKTPPGNRTPHRPRERGGCNGGAGSRRHHHSKGRPGPWRVGGHSLWYRCPLLKSPNYRSSNYRSGCPAPPPKIPPLIPGPGAPPVLPTCLFRSSPPVVLNFDLYLCPTSFYFLFPCYYSLILPIHPLFSVVLPLPDCAGQLL